MNDHRHYGKIHRLGKEEVAGILEGTCVVQEKVDGANTSIWLDDEGDIKMGSRTRILKGDEEFNGFVPYVNAHRGIKLCLEENPTYRLYGEWLVRHTIAYKETAYKKFYLFDIYDTDHFLRISEVQSISETYGIDMVPTHGRFENLTLENLQEFVGKTEFGDRGEGIVIKNYDYVNGFGDCAFAKIVTESFKEDNAVSFGGNNKFSDTYHEVYVVNKYMTLPRIQKIMHKLQPEINEKLDMKHIPRIMGTAYHDMLTEEIWGIVKDVPKLDFKSLKRISDKKSKQIFVDLINDDVNVHDKVEEKSPWGTTKPEEWKLTHPQNYRDMHASGFVEAICAHGIGHHNGVHGCDGCCANMPEEIKSQITTY